MPNTTIGRWRLDCDAETTSQCYAQLLSGAGCDCADCRNFRAGGEQFFPPEFRRFCDDLER